MNSASVHLGLFMFIPTEMWRYICRYKKPAVHRGSAVGKLPIKSLYLLGIGELSDLTLQQHPGLFG